MRAMPGKLVDIMLKGRMGVLDTGVSGGSSVEEAEVVPLAALASAIADATGTFV